MASDSSQRYKILRRLDAGGMAEVFLGHSVSLEGFEKSVAIKRVLPSLSANAKFVNMFKDEARLSLYLNHANIVSVFEVGRVDDVHFIVMEYVDGTNLRRVQESLHKQRRSMPWKLALFVVVEMSKGLDYAHNRTDGTGQSLNIVHRDISPPNILVSKEGEVKLTDFGLAKAKSQVELTDPGVVKGKFSYLCPEASWGHEVDHRADIYAAGIVLWELLAGRRLFLGETDIQTLEMVRAGEIPSLQPLNSDVDAELDAIVKKALAKDPGDRFQQARELGTALSRYMANRGVHAGSFEFAEFLRSLEDPEASRAKGDDEVIDTVIQEEVNRLIGMGTASQEPKEEAPAGGGFLNPLDWDLGEADWASALPDVPEEEELPAPPAPRMPAMSAQQAPRRPTLPPQAAPAAPKGTMVLGASPLAGLGGPRPPAAAPQPVPSLPPLPSVDAMPTPPPTAGGQKTMMGLPSLPGVAGLTAGRRGMGTGSLPAVPPPGTALPEDPMELAPLAELSSPMEAQIRVEPPPKNQRTLLQMGPMPLGSGLETKGDTKPAPEPEPKAEGRVAQGPSGGAGQERAARAISDPGAGRAAGGEGGRERAAERRERPKPVARPEPSHPPEPAEKSNKVLLLVLVGLIGVLVVVLFNLLAKTT